jgi:hypothetical protein
MPVVMRWNTGNLSIGVAIPWSMRHAMAAVHQTLVLVHCDVGLSTRSSTATFDRGSGNDDRLVKHRSIRSSNRFTVVHLV